MLIINFKNLEVRPNAKILPNGTKYDYKILEDKQTKEKMFYAILVKVILKI